MAQQPPSEPPPDWLANPSDYQAPAAPTAYQEWTPESEKAVPPESFVAAVPTYTPAQAQAIQAADGWSISFGSTRLTGWHAALAIGGVFALWTAVELGWDISTNGAYQAYASAPACAVPSDSCRAEFAADVTGYKPSSSSCIVTAQRGTSGDSYTGEFTSDACNGLSGFLARYARVGVWHGQLVYVWRGSQYWSTDSTVGQHMEAASGVLLPLFLDAFFVVAAVLSLLYRLVNRKGQG